jgi:hypothetical protein
VASVLRKKDSVPAVALSLSLLEVSIPDPSIDAIFQAFDGRKCDIDGTTCCIAVYGVHDDGHSKWVQLCVDGLKQTMLTLRLASSEPGPGFISRIA